MPRHALDNADISPPSTRYNLVLLANDGVSVQSCYKPSR